MGFPLHFSLHTFPFGGEEAKNIMWVVWILIINPSIVFFVHKLRFGGITCRLECFLYGLWVFLFFGFFWGLACSCCSWCLMCLGILQLFAWKSYRLFKVKLSYWQGAWFFLVKYSFSRHLRPSVLKYCLGISFIFIFIFFFFFLFKCVLDRWIV